MIKRYHAIVGLTKLSGILFVSDDGLVTLYGGAYGTYGYYWPGEQAFGPEGITAFLATTDAEYAANKLTFHTRKSAVREAKRYIIAIWPSLTAQLKDTKNVGAS